ncbi:MAG: hypothetical protein LUC96_14510 [Alistipes sp.]|uniref:hypothetical protein n=1 Tax=Alistipes sp. TaxID=1872444 RepID=UPI0025BFC0F5|nr:hypothetical protein [Alistipes sp.]MCD8276167.1 hypothetical protein [Alistipes sp.]
MNETIPSLSTSSEIRPSAVSHSSSAETGAIGRPLCAEVERREFVGDFDFSFRGSLAVGRRELIERKRNGNRASFRTGLGGPFVEKERVTVRADEIIHVCGLRQVAGGEADGEFDFIGQRRGFVERVGDAVGRSPELSVGIGQIEVACAREIYAFGRNLDRIDLLGSILPFGGEVERELRRRGFFAENELRFAGRPDLFAPGDHDVVGACGPGVLHGADNDRSRKSVHGAYGRIDRVKGRLLEIERAVEFSGSGADAGCDVERAGVQAVGDGNGVVNEPDGRSGFIGSGSRRRTFIRDVCSRNGCRESREPVAEPCRRGNLLRLIRIVRTAEQCRAADCEH